MRGQAWGASPPGEPLRGTIGKSRSAAEIQTCSGGRVGRTSQVRYSKMGIDRRSDLDPRRHCNFSFLATRETENICNRISDSRKIDRGSTLRESKPRP